MFETNCISYELNNHERYGMKQLITPLLPEVVFMYGYEWRKTPGYVNVYINNEGEVRLLNSKNELITASIQQWKTTKGTYKYAKVINDNFVPVQKAVHQLVCLTYHGQPPQDGRTYEPNHKDGDKHNNRPSNLEWLTRSNNVQHAFDQGLCKTGIRIQAKNVVTGELKKYNSLSSMARDWNLSRSELNNILTMFSNKLYNGIWSFNVDRSSDMELNRHQNRTVICKDYLDDTITIYTNAAEAALYTNVKAGTILYRMNLQKDDLSYNRLLSRYVFRTVDNKDDWPIYSKEEAVESEVQYNQNASKPQVSRK